MIPEYLIKNISGEIKHFNFVHRKTFFIKLQHENFIKK